MTEENGNGKGNMNRVFPMGNPRPIFTPRQRGYAKKTERPDRTGRAPK